MRYRVCHIRDLSPIVKEFHLCSEDASPLTPWTAGAHLRLTLELPDGRRLERHYSLVGQPGACDVYRIVVLLDHDGNGGSAHLHAAVHVGDLLQADGPINTFALHASSGRTVLVAGGIGITPLVSMAHALVGAEQSASLHYLAKAEDRLVLLDDLPATTRAAMTAYTPERGNVRPNLHTVLGHYTPGAQLYACGPVGLLQSLQEAARAMDWPDAAIHMESFGARVAADDQALEVYLAQSQLSISVPAGTTLLDALLGAGMFVSYECQRGECAHCFTSVLEGTPLHRDVCLTPAQRALGMCTCVSRASTGRLVLDL